MGVIGLLCVSALASSNINHQPTWWTFHNKGKQSLHQPSGSLNFIAVNYESCRMYTDTFPVVSSTDQVGIHGVGVGQGVLFAPVSECFLSCYNYCQLTQQPVTPQSCSQVTTHPQAGEEQRMICCCPFQRYGGLMRCQLLWFRKRSKFV